MTLTQAESRETALDARDPETPHSDAAPCLHALFEEQVRRTPDDVALVFEGQRLTYAELDRRAGRVAAALARRGLAPESLVGLLVERSLEMVVGILGILKAGAAYLPIEPSYPQERIAFMLADAKAGVVLSQNRLSPVLPAGVEAISLDAFDWLAAEEPLRVGARVRPEHLAYVIYTSGSTGRPKGVCIEHRNIVSYVRAIVERLRLEPGMSYATLSTIAADLGHTALFPALATGGCLHVVSQERAESQALLTEYFEREAIDVLKIVPSHLAALQSGQDPARLMPRRRLVLGGEPSRLDWIEALRAAAPGCEIHNHYGPTEATVGVMTYAVGPTLPRTASGTLPLGRPLPNSRVSILGGDGHPVPAGAQGELCIGGAGVARGYLDRPELTAEKFVPDPLGTGPAARMYRTGDMARSLPDGTVEFGGRIDHQVKLHGYRVELGEIEQALRDHPGVRDAVVLVRDDGPGGRQLAAFVIPERTRQPLWQCESLHVLPDGSPVAHLNKSETDYLYHEIFVLQAYLRHGITLNDGDCVVDAGSNIGLFTVFASRLARNLRLLAFEPNPAAFACLKANAEAWGRGVTCLPVGLSRENGSADLTFFEGLSLLSGFYADAATEREVVRNYVLNQQAGAGASDGWDAGIGSLIDDRLRAKTVSARLRTLSDVLAEEGIERVDFLKVNVEKSELDVLMGLRPGDWPKVRQLVVEVDQHAHVAPITALLEGQGFEVLGEQDPLLRRTDLCYVYAIRPSATGPGLVREPAHDAHIRPLPPPDPMVLTPTTLRRDLKRRLPQYMVPSAFVPMDKWPLTSNGKLDRHALALVSPERASSAAEFVRPQTETERALAAIWREILKVEEIGVNDDFFELGGQSLLAIRAVSRIRDVFQVDMPLRNLFERPTLAGLAEVIDGLSWLARPKSPSGARGEREEVEL